MLCYTDRSCRCSQAKVSTLTQESVFSGKHLKRKKCSGKNPAEPLAEKCFKNQPRTQKAFCQSHSLDALFCRGVFPYLGGGTRPRQPQCSQQSQEGRSIRGFGRLGRLLTSGWKSSGQEPHIPRTQRLPREHLLLPRPLHKLLYKPSDSIV